MVMHACKALMFRNTLADLTYSHEVSNGLSMCEHALDVNVLR